MARDEHAPADNELHAVELMIEHARKQVLPALHGDDALRRAIPSALFSRALTLVEAIVVLGRAGYGREVLMLNRALFELLVDARWAHANGDLAQERLVQHARFTQHRQREMAARYQDIFGSLDDREPLSDEELETLRGLFGTYAHKGWTGLTMHQRVTAIGEQFGEGQGQLQAYFEILHGASNAELHPSSWSLGRALRRVPGSDEEMLQVRTSSEQELVPVGLGQTWWIFGQLLALIHENAGIPDDDLLDVGDVSARLMGFDRLPGAEERPPES
jgi:hypothetical protein